MRLTTGPSTGSLPGPRATARCGGAAVRPCGRADHGAHHCGDPGGRGAAVARLGRCAASRLLGRGAARRRPASPGSRTSGSSRSARSPRRSGAPGGRSGRHGAAPAACAAVAGRAPSPTCPHSAARTRTHPYVTRSSARPRATPRGRCRTGRPGGSGARRGGGVRGRRGVRGRDRGSCRRTAHGGRRCPTAGRRSLGMAPVQPGPAAAGPHPGGVAGRAPRPRGAYQWRDTTGLTRGRAGGTPSDDGPLLPRPGERRGSRSPWPRRRSTTSASSRPPPLPAPAGGGGPACGGRAPIPSVVPERGRLPRGPTAALTGRLPDRRLVLANPAR